MLMAAANSNSLYSDGKRSLETVPYNCLHCSAVGIDHQRANPKGRTDYEIVQ